MCIFGELEVVAALIACEGEQYDPFALVAEERSHAVLAHVGGHGEGIDVEVFEKGARVHGARVADVATLGVGNDEVIGMVLANVRDCLLEGLPSLAAEALVESEVGLIGHAIGGGGVDNGLVEIDDGGG